MYQARDKSSEFSQKSIFSAGLCLCLLIFCLLPPIAQANRFATISRSTENGLTQSQVRALLQDSQGFLWIGTLAGGVDRFDGRDYTHFTKRQGLPSNIVYKLWEVDGIIYAGTRLGLARLEADDQFKAMPLPPGFDDAHVTDMAQDAQGRLYIATYSGLFRVDGDRLLHEKSLPPELKGVVLDSHGNLWAATSQQLYRREGNTGLFNPIPTDGDVAPIRRMSPRQGGGIYIANRHEVFVADITGSKNIPLTALPTGSRIASLYEDGDASLWLGTASGALHLSLDGQQELIGPDEGLPEATISAITRDSEGTLHLGTNGEGLISLPTVPFMTWTQGPLINYAPTRPVWHAEGQGQTLYIPTLGDGLWRLKGEDLFQFGPDEGLDDPDVVFVYPDAQKRIWVGLSTGLVQLKGDRIQPLSNLPPRFQEHWFLEVAELQDGTLAFATSGGFLLWQAGKFREIGQDLGFPAEELMSIQAAGPNQVWIGSHSGAILYDIDAQKVIQHLKTENGLPSNTVSMVYRDKRGFWWFGTDLGLVKWDGRILQTLTWEDGLPEGHINFMIQHPSSDDLWIGTNRGVVVWDGLRFRTYTHAQGLPAQETNSFAAAVDPQGRLWLGTERGYGIYDPAIQVPVNTVNTLLTRALVDGKARDDAQSIELDYAKNSIRWNFLSPTYIRPDQVKYRIRLIGSGENWEEISERTVRYTALSPGEYYFEVAGCLEGRCDPSPAQSPLLIIHPPWYQRPSVIAGGLLAIFFAGVLVTYGRSLRLRRRAELLEREVQIRTKELAAEKDVNEALLQNILPKDIIGELKDNGAVQPRRFQDVSILFTDLKGFTKTASVVPPEQLVQQLNDIFQAFDHIAQEFGLEKLKTIGDAYMAVGGLPSPNTTHPVDAVAAGLKMQAYMEERRQSVEGIPFELRVGIHTGEVVAGVIGTWKYAYDVWGDAVNIAARMESSGEPGKVNISKPTFERVQSTFECQARGKLPVKGKGELDMFFVRGARLK